MVILIIIITINIIIIIIVIIIITIIIIIIIIIIMIFIVIIIVMIFIITIVILLISITITIIIIIILITNDYWSFVQLQSINRLPLMVGELFCCLNTVTLIKMNVILKLLLLRRIHHVHWLNHYITGSTTFTRTAWLYPRLKDKSISGNLNLTKICRSSVITLSSHVYDTRYIKMKTLRTSLPHPFFFLCSAVYEITLYHITLNSTLWILLCFILVNCMSLYGTSHDGTLHDDTLWHGYKLHRTTPSSHYPTVRPCCSTPC